MLKLMQKFFLHKLERCLFITFEVSILFLRFPGSVFKFPSPCSNLCMCLFCDTFKAIEKNNEANEIYVQQRALKNNQVNIAKLTCQK